ncbi:hypothetical protein F8388_026855 [Cannabis sativa]|uniref:Pseudouridine synthase RsuA/RluA-like domain-containing protein n=1 Tax=Cannabis sativa TaxID=3483 RepID=A0A7J6H1N3_CANSA|nr:hypothetical protein F8388_026855 [Cannabis sativa]
MVLLVDLDTLCVNVSQPIGIVQYPGVAKGLYVASPSGKPALSKVEVLERDTDKNCTLVQVEIQSGRPHQIRIHLAFIGHPLLGDPLYVVGGGPQRSDSEYLDENFALDGGFLRPTKPVPGDCGYSLHAHKVTLSHPTTNERLFHPTFGHGKKCKKDRHELAVRKITRLFVLSLRLIKHAGVSSPFAPPAFKVSTLICIEIDHQILLSTKLYLSIAMTTNFTLKSPLHENHHISEMHIFGVERIA